MIYCKYCLTVRGQYYLVEPAYFSQMSWKSQRIWLHTRLELLELALDLLMMLFLRTLAGVMLHNKQWGLDLSIRNLGKLSLLLVFLIWYCFAGLSSEAVWCRQWRWWWQRLWTTKIQVCTYVVAWAIGLIIIWWVNYFLNQLINTSGHRLHIFGNICRAKKDGYQSTTYQYSSNLHRVPYCNSVLYNGFPASQPFSIMLQFSSKT